MRSRAELVNEIKETFAERPPGYQTWSPAERLWIFAQTPEDQATIQGFGLEAQELLKEHNTRQSWIRELTDEERWQREAEVQELLGVHGPNESTRLKTRKELTDEAMEEYGLVGWRKHAFCIGAALAICFGWHHNRE